jgi:hypothetical protein
VHREGGNGERGDVAQHVSGIRDQSKRVGGDAARELDDHEDRGNGEDEEETSLTRSAQRLTAVATGLGMVAVLVRMVV